MNDGVRPTIIVINGNSKPKKIIQALQVARAIMTTVIVYSFFVKAVETINKTTINVKTECNKEV